MSISANLQMWTWAMARLNLTWSSTTWIRTTTVLMKAQTRIILQAPLTTKRTTWKPQIPKTQGTGTSKGTGNRRRASPLLASREEQRWRWWRISRLATWRPYLWRSAFTPRQQRLTTSYERSSPRKSGSLADVCSHNSLMLKKMCWDC